MRPVWGWAIYLYLTIKALKERQRYIINCNVWGYGEMKLIIKPMKHSIEEIKDPDEHYKWLLREMNRYDFWYVSKKKAKGEKVDWYKCRVARAAYFKEEIDKHLFGMCQEVQPFLPQNLTDQVLI